MALLPLIPTIQHYAWGGNHFIPKKLGMTDYNPTEPYAELWMGAHPKSPSALQTGKSIIPLPEWIDENPKQALGVSVLQQFGTKLPFLFKILDVKEMLSIQVHPSKEAAISGFERENKMGIPLDAPNRNYKDPNHKPELMLALTEFWTLHGFMTEDKILKSLINTPELTVLANVFRRDKSIGHLYGYLMRMPQPMVNKMLAPLEKRLSEATQIPKENPDYWAKKAFERYTQAGNYDRGIFSIYLFNLLKLKRGDVIYQGSGMPHAYLEGVNVELMANSDNVFRGGLTPKHIDIDELLSNMDFRPTVPHIIASEKINRNQVVFKTLAPDFELSEITLSASDVLQVQPGLGPAIYFVMEGKVSIDEQIFTEGKCFWVDDDTVVKMEGEGKIFRAGMPK